METKTQIEGTKTYRDYVHDTIKAKIDQFESVSDDNYEMESTPEEVEHESRSGFMPFQEGGHRLVSFLCSSSLEGAGSTLPEKAQEKFEKQRDNLRESMSNEMKINIPAVKDFKGVINYSDAEELDIVEEFTEYESEWLDDSDQTIMFVIGAHFKDKTENRLADSNECFCYITYNFDTGYHRDGNNEICYLEEFTFDNKNELQAGLDKAFAKLIEDTKLTIN